jgi:hypothetical protein
MEIISDKAILYVEEQLSLGGKTLSNYLRYIYLQNGRIYSFVPQETTEEHLYNFDSGGIYPFDKKALDTNSSLVPIRNDAKSVIVDFIYEYLQEKDNCCIFEEANGSPSDPWVKESGIEYVSIRNEMYYYFDRENNSKEKIEKALTTSDGYYFLCVLGKLEIDKRALFIPNKEIPPFIFEEFIKQVKAIIVKAYDGEGYLMWEGV